jgi:hypothetical protein
MASLCDHQAASLPWLQLAQGRSQSVRGGTHHQTAKRTAPSSRAIMHGSAGICRGNPLATLDQHCIQRPRIYVL